MNVDGVPADGREAIGRTLTESWGGCTYVARTRHVLQVRDTALVVADAGVHVLHRGGDGAWRASISLLDLRQLIRTSERSPPCPNHSGDAYRCCSPPCVSSRCPPRLPAPGPRQPPVPPRPRARLRAVPAALRNRQHGLRQRRSVTLAADHRRTGSGVDLRRLRRPRRGGHRHSAAALRARSDRVPARAARSQLQYLVKDVQRPPGVHRRDRALQRLVRRADSGAGRRSCASRCSSAATAATGRSSTATPTRWSTWSCRPPSSGPLGSRRASDRAP